MAAGNLNFVSEKLEPKHQNKVKGLDQLKVISEFTWISQYSHI